MHAEMLPALHACTLLSKTIILKNLTEKKCIAQGITQVIDAEGGRVQNIADFRIGGSMNGYLNVEGTVALAGPDAQSGEAVRVDVKFTAFSLKLGALPAARIPLEWGQPHGEG